MSGSASASFTYDADGKRVKGVVDGQTTVYVGEHYEAEHSEALQLTVQSSRAVANGYTYRTFDNQTQYVIQAGDTLEFDVYLDSANPQFKAGLDAILSISGIVRSSGWVDQNGLGIHPNVDLTAYARGKWYHRVFNMSSKAGQTLSTFKIAHEGDAAGTYRIWLDDVKVTNNGVVRKVIYEKGAPAVNLQAEGPTSEITQQRAVC